MKQFELSSMTKGWFVGNFSPTVFDTNACEVAVKRYIEGEYEDLHYHKIAHEITVVVSGRIRMLDKEWSEGDIVMLSPFEATDFTALTNAICVVVKIPGCLDDKYQLLAK